MSYFPQKTTCAVALVAVAANPGEHVASPGCSSGNTYPRGDVHRVYAIPHGGTWIYHPDGHFFSIGPQGRCLWVQHLRRLLAAFGGPGAPRVVGPRRNPLRNPAGKSVRQMGG